MGARILLIQGHPDCHRPHLCHALAEAYVEPAARGQGISRVLLATALAWAYDRGYRQVAADWPAASPMVAGHWPKVGFAPAAYRLCRILDPRIVLAPGATADADELRAFCAERLSDYKVPRRWTFATELPRNATGKVVKRDLLDLT